MIAINSRLEQGVDRPANESLRSLLLRIMLAALSVIVSFVVSLKAGASPGNTHLFLLPVLYGVLLSVMPHLWRFAKGHLGMTILNIVIFGRYVISPYFRSLAIDDPPIRGVVPSEDGTNLGIVIMLVELVVTFSLVQLLARKVYSKRAEAGVGFEPLESKHFLVATLALGLGLFVAFPSLIERYTFFIVAEPVERAALDVPLSGLIILLTDLVLVVFPVLMIDYFKKKYDKSPKFKYVLLSLVFILPSITVFKGTSRFSVLIPTIAFLVILLKLYPEYKKRLTAIVGSVLLMVFLSITLYKQFDYTRGDTLDAGIDANTAAYNLDAYMSGPDNMGRVADMASTGTYDINSSTLFNDLANNIALVSNLADSSDTTTAKFNYHLYERGGIADQIVPLSGQSYLHFGALGSPLLLTVTVILMMHFDNRIKREDRIEYVYLFSYITVYLSMGMMVSLGSIFPLFFNLLLPLAVIFGLNRRLLLSSSQ